MTTATTTEKSNKMRTYKGRPWAGPSNLVGQSAHGKVRFVETRMRGSDDKTTGRTALVAQNDGPFISTPEGLVSR